MLLDVSECLSSVRWSRVRISESEWTWRNQIHLSPFLVYSILPVWGLFVLINAYKNSAHPESMCVFMHVFVIAIYQRFTSLSGARNAVRTKRSTKVKHQNETPERSTKASKTTARLRSGHVDPVCLACVTQPYKGILGSLIRLPYCFWRDIKVMECIRVLTYRLPGTWWFA